MDFIYFFFAIVASSLIFSIIFRALNDSVLELFRPIQRYVRKLKRKELLYYIAFFIIVFVNALWLDMFSFWIRGLIFGFFMALIEMIFDKQKMKDVASKEAIND